MANFSLYCSASCRLTWFVNIAELVSTDFSAIFIFKSVTVSQLDVHYLQTWLQVLFFLFSIFITHIYVDIILYYIYKYTSLFAHLLIYLIFMRLFKPKMLLTKNAWKNVKNFKISIKFVKIWQNLWQNVDCFSFE